MFSQRGLVSLAHTPHELRELSRRVNAIRLNGIDSEILDVAQIKASVRSVNTDPEGALSRARRLAAAARRHGAPRRRSPGASPRAADSRGVDIIRTARSPASASQTAACRASRPRAALSAPRRSASSVAGHASVMAERAGFRMPIESHPLQALVSEPVKPVLDTVVMSSAVHVYVSQSDKGELVMGAGIDAYNSYSSAAARSSWRTC
jgi:sarcosine oxidase subunit beta